MSINVLSLDELIADRLASEHRLRKEVILPAGVYQRLPMFMVDLHDLQPDQMNLFKAYRERLAQEHYATERVILHDALVCGQGSVIVNGQHLLRESALEFLAHHQTPDNLEPGRGGTFSLTAPVIRRVTRPTLLLQRPWFTNYGHWLVDGAAMLALLSRVAMPAGWQIMIGLQPSNGMRDIVLETLSTLAPGIGIVERPQQEVWRFDQLHYLTPIHVPPLYKHPEAIACLRACISCGHLVGSSQNRRLFVYRGDLPSRRLDNEKEVTDLLSNRGFSMLSNEPRSLREQARLFRSAQIVVGVKGAALTNMMFAAAGSHLITLSPADFPDPFFWDLVSQSGIHYSELFGELTTTNLQQSHNSFRIDLDSLVVMLDAVEERLVAI